ncbi:hypothetical protein DYL59_06320 [Pseudomonas kairouanensis]|uniref:Uncharacterized protein n=1 Tax=Pseudomonas kairouanensis TaxID=2293832 RepID=A0A4Z0AXP3_9PSED|nr:hypothetical protein DYL59_06320 [Pseudomonas kairouanensis]
MQRARHRFTGLPGQLQPDDDVGLFIARVFVGASLLAKVVNDYPCKLEKRGALERFASKLAPTGESVRPGP